MRCLFSLLVLAIYLEIALAGTNDCDDFLVSGTQPLVSSGFPTEARLFNGKGWINDTIKINLVTKSDVKKIAIQACNTDATSTMFFKITFLFGSNFVYYVDQFFNQILYSVTTDCFAIKYIQFSAKTTAVKIKPYGAASTQMFRIDLVGCPIVSEAVGGIRSSWMTSHLLSNINITDSIRWVTNKNTFFECSKECESDVKCDSFVVTNDGKCQGHEVGQTALIHDSEVKPGLQFYIKNDGYKIESKTGLLYKIYSQRRNLNAAKSQCNSDGGHLIALDSLEKIQIIWNILQGNLILAQESQFLVSGYNDSDGKWKFWTGIEIPDFMWKSGIAADKHACVAMGYQGYEKTQCDPLYFICQKPLFIDQVMMG